jgi:uncharacterized phiE125 gp8 family phage protein
MIRHVRVVTHPTVEPVTVQEARLWCRIDADDATQDAMLQLLIIAMREHAEALTGRSFARKTYEMVMDEFPPNDEVIELPYPPLVSVSYVTYADGDGADQTLAGSPDAFLVDAGSAPGRISPLYGGQWPSTRAQIGAVRIGYVAGYATTNLVPKAFRIWMQARIATLYENREQLVMNNVVEIPREFADGLLDILRVRTGFV